MRPTGKLHLGHLVGALNNWVKLQELHECLFMVADWHALMSEYEDPSAIQENIFDNVADWLACGIDPVKSIVFVQSQVKEHLELSMIFSLITPLGWLERCPTYKEQLKQVANRDLKTYAFLGYPVLQAADILLYKATAVPVGEDQLPHLELTREIGRRFNSLYKKELFPEPEGLLTKFPRLLGLDGRKMSKSYDNFIAISEPSESLKKKVMNMFTDPERIRITDPGHPDKCNVHNYYKLFAPEREKEVATLCRQAKVGCINCKKELSQILIDYLAPLQKKKDELAKDKKKIELILEAGREKAHVLAKETISQAKKLLGI